MDVILVPGFWLDASSWDKVTPPLIAAGHSVYPLTLPGLESIDAPRAGIGLRTHVDAVVRQIDGIQRPVVLVGHSGGAAIIYAAIDVRPNRVRRGIYVDSGPLAAGGAINDQLPAVGDEIPLPPWESFEAADLVDLSDDLRAAFRARAIPEPKGVAYDKQQLSNDRRLQVAATIVACEFRSAQLLEWVKAGAPYAAELGRLANVQYVDLPTGTGHNSPSRPNSDERSSQQWSEVSQ